LLIISAITISGNIFRDLFFPQIGFPQLDGEPIFVDSQIDRHMYEKYQNDITDVAFFNARSGALLRI
jgi:hypothetical protein